ncbi:amino acid/polyamine/organocation transporter, APC superfamily [Alicyclobacillus vulcanalis]|uniref:Amino acid/polyamine/organocation transporter, APC superfamily n=2 Tax=Alicyclobacillus vulcanalis TaxID=252246 RepID=A0A1N7JQV6_9BACL|nr:amino acid/polyamine/organocation transporter, APC superfamily [Alicyclobacillus vulcanalis]
MTALKKGEITTLEAMAISVAIMAPTAAMALNGALVASIAGTAVPLTFFLAMIVIGMVSYSFIRFNRFVSSSGSVYAFTAMSLGPRAGFLSGWALLFAYLVFTAASSAEVGAFLQSFFAIIRLNVGWLIPAVVTLLLLLLLAFFDVRLGARVMLVFEGISIMLILILSIAILLRGGASHHLSLLPFTLKHTSLSSVAFASVFAFLSFAGFEGASSLGEETRDATKAIPLAIGAAIFLTGGFYILSTYTQTIGFGLNPSGVRTFAQSSAPLGLLAEQYISRTFAAVLMLGATLSAFSSALGTATTASRLLYSLGKSRLLLGTFGTTHPRYGSPYIALSAVGVMGLLQLILLRQLPGITVFGDLGSLGVLSLLLAYISTNTGYIFFARRKKDGIAALVLPLISILALVYTLYANVYPIPAYPSNLFPYIVVMWIGLGVLVLLFEKNTVQKVETWLKDEYGFSKDSLE